MPRIQRRPSAPSAPSEPTAGGSKQPGLVASALARLQAEGLPIPDKPADKLPSLPDDLGGIHDRRLVEWMQIFTAWADYLNVQVALAEVDEGDCEARVELAKARIMAGAGRGEVNRARAEAKSSPEAAVLAADHAYAKAYRKMITALYANCERDAALLSRELTRRTSLHPKLNTVAGRRP